MKKYRLGNLLRGGFSGEFESMADAWAVLGTRFLLSYPCEDFEGNERPDGGRMVYMHVYEENQYGMKSWALCMSDYTRMESRISTDLNQVLDDNGVQPVRCSDVEFF